jgi:hypothetical protein
MVADFWRWWSGGFSRDFGRKRWLACGELRGKRGKWMVKRWFEIALFLVQGRLVWKKGSVDLEG